MVCDRCKTVLKQELENAGIGIVSVELGELVVLDDISVSKSVIQEIANQNGFEIIDNPTSELVENLKSLLIGAVENLKGFEENTSSFLSHRLKTDYSIISKTFSATTGITVEKYLIRLKIEKAKELLQMETMTFSEIAYALDYSAGSHLAKQFKSVTGISMTEYRKLQKWNRKTLDRIV